MNSPLTRFCLLLPLVGIFILCGRLSLSNPGFVDGVPVLLFLILSGFALGLWLVGFWVARYVPSERTLFQRILNKKIFHITLLIVFGASALLSAIAYYVNSKVLSSPPRLLLIGLDGATWDLIDPLMRAGKMLHMQQLCASGARGNLQSLESLESPSLWTSIATGLPPEQHGITGFFSTGLDIKAPRVWDICQEKGIKVGLFAWMVGWPPESQFAFSIPSWFSRAPDTFPPEYECVQEILLDQDRYGGPVNPIRGLWQCAALGARYRGVESLLWFYLRDTLGLSEEERLAYKMLAEVRLQADVFIAMLRRYSPQVATFSLYGTDKLAHRFWHEMTPTAFNPPNTKSQFSHVIEEYYQEADRAIGRILRVLSSSVTVVVVSDHGMKADTALPQQFFLDAPELLRVLGWSRQFHPTTLQRKVILESTPSRSISATAVIALLQQIHLEGDSEPVFSVETGREGGLELQTNFSLTWNPDSPLVTHSKIWMNGKSYATPRLFFSRTFSGTHDPQGIWLLAGPNIQSQQRFNANLLDVAPTLLYLLHLPISREMKGRLLTEILDKDCVSQNPPEFVERYELKKPEPIRIEENEHFLEHLRSVGYVH